MMQPWFTDAKLGIFLHWGIYSVDGVAESWSFFHGQAPYDRYMAQLDGFTASRYDPDAWAELFDRAGARTPCSPPSTTTASRSGTPRQHLSVVAGTPAGRDLVASSSRPLRAPGNEGRPVLLPPRLVPPRLRHRAALVRAARRSTDNRFRTPAPGRGGPERVGALPGLPPRPDPGTADPLRARPALVRRRVGARRAVADGELRGRSARSRRRRSSTAGCSATATTRPRNRACRIVAAGRPVGAVPDHQRLLGLAAAGRPTTSHRASSCAPSWRPSAVAATSCSTSGRARTAPSPPSRPSASRRWATGSPGTPPPSTASAAAFPHGHFYGPTAVSADRRTLYLFVLRPAQRLRRGPRPAQRRSSRRTVLGTGTELDHRRVGGLARSPAGSTSHPTTTSTRCAPCSPSSSTANWTCTGA